MCFQSGHWYGFMSQVFLHILLNDFGKQLKLGGGFIDSFIIQMYLASEVFCLLVLVPVSLLHLAGTPP